MRITNEFPNGVGQNLEEDGTTEMAAVNFRAVILKMYNEIIYFNSDNIVRDGVAPNSPGKRVKFVFLIFFFHFYFCFKR